MAVGRVMVYENGIISSVSKKCFSCENYDCKREIMGYERFCGGIVVRLRCSEESECRRTGKPVNYNSKCSDWKAYSKLMEFLEKVS